MDDGDVGIVHMEQDVFRAPGDAHHPVAGQRLRQALGEGNPHIFSPQGQAGDALALENGLQAAADGLDLGQFGHTHS